MPSIMATAPMHAKNVHVVCLLGGDRIRIEITDEGRGFDPAALPDPTCGDHLHAPCGRGVMLMRAFMSRVEFNARGNGVTMEKEREPGGENRATRGCLSLTSCETTRTRSPR